MKFKDKTRGGFAVEIFATDLSGPYPILGAVTDEKGKRLATAWDVSGNFNRCSGDHRDLIPIPDYSDFEKGEICRMWNDGDKGKGIGFFSHANGPDRKAVVSSHAQYPKGLLPWDHCEKVFQPLDVERIIELWEEAGSVSVFFARRIEEEIMKQVTK